MHKYQVYNDKHHWPSTLLVPKNLFLSFLWTTQKTWHKCTNMSLSSHILASNSIHYIALLGLNIQIVKKLNYLYHLSDEMKHNYVLTTSGVDDICHLKINLKSFILSLTTALHNINPNMFFNIGGVQIMVLQVMAKFWCML